MFRIEISTKSLVNQGIRSQRLTAKWFSSYFLRRYTMNQCSQGALFNTRRR